MTIWQIALPVAGADYYDYLAPEDAPGEMLGHAVQVPFARRSLNGIVVGHSEHSQVPANRLRRVHSILSERPLVDAQSMALLRFAAQHYQYPLGLTVATALPPGVFGGAPTTERAFVLTAQGRAQLSADGVRGQRQRSVVEQLAEATAPTPRSAIAVPAAVLARLQELDWIRSVDQAQPQASPATPVPLRQGQKQVAEAILTTASPTTHLLLGATGSGKTEVYLHLAQHILAQGRQVLMLVPEISLTPQMVERISQRLGAAVSVLHSGQSPKERLRHWFRARDGEAGLVLGTRSSVFVPLPQLGLVVVDEEHEASYKQQDGLRYSGRDLAVYRGWLQQAPVILGSATPSLESLHNVSQGRYTQHELQAGPQGRRELRLIDMQGLPSSEPLSPILRQQMRKTLDGEGQVFLFLNRRGYAPLLYCPQCQWSPQCRRCDVAMVWHRQAGQLRCHHCGHQQRVPSCCPSCEHPELVPVGWGTQRVMEALQTHFPDVPAIRFDRDSLTRKGALEDALERLHSNQARIVVGTQMLAKGHDFPHLSLVAVIDADSGLYSADFRATERLGQLLTQVRGRAGRRAQDAQCLIQTRNPSHPHLQAWLAGGYQRLSQLLLEERQDIGWPPYSKLAAIRIEAAQEASLDQFWQHWQQALAGPWGCEMLGPIALARRSGRFRSQIVLRHPQRPLLGRELTTIREELEHANWARKVRWSVDVDPWSLD
nr:primosomal protein N' [Oceanococcus sp. HetDA_MAG_MS8]